MQFYIKSEKSQIEEFSKLLTTQQLEIMADIDVEITLNIDDCGRLSLSWKDYTSLYITAEKDLRYHKNFFYKHSIYKEPLARAIGLKKGKEKPSVIDATGGMLGDSLLMLSLGVEQLTVFERNPVLAMLILDSIKHDQLDIQFYYGSAVNSELQAQVIYFDPMYHEKNSKAAPKKSMAIFRELVGADIDAYNVALDLMKKNAERLVIKRSRKASPLLENPHHTIEGKSTCYDVYLCSN